MSTPTRRDRFERGTEEFQRVLGFTDGVVAIAMTLLVLSIDVPSPQGDPGDADVLAIIGDLMGSIGAFALSFLIIAFSWMGHHRFLGSLGAIDRPLILWNIGFLFVVVFVPLVSELVGKYGSNPVAVTIYALWMALLQLLDLLGYAVARHDRLFLQSPSPAAVRHAVGAMLIPVVLFLVVIPVGFLFRSWAFFLLFLVRPLEWLWDRYGPATRADGPAVAG